MGQKTSETWITCPKRMLESITRDACLVHIYPTGAAMGTRYSLGHQDIILGRAEDCHLRIQDHSVSRRHVRIEPTPEGYYVSDLQSTNGTFVNDEHIDTACLLHDGDYLRVGNCIYRYLAGGNIEAEYHEEIYRLTIMDGLTQVHNRRHMVEFLERESVRSRRHDRPLSVLILDIDKFKTLNDTYGHLCGDFVLRELAVRIRETVRKEDLFARYGGEEFALVLVETALDEAAAVAERVRKLVAHTPFRFENTQLTLTVSIGVATTTGEPGLPPDDLLRAADDKLYAAKRGGRDRVES